MVFNLFKPKKTDKFVRFDSYSWEGDSTTMVFYSSGLVEWSEMITPTSGGDNKLKEKDFSLSKKETDDIFKKISKFVQECSEDNAGIDVDKDRFHPAYLIYGFSKRGLPFAISGRSPEFEKFEKILAPVWEKIKEK